MSHGIAYGIDYGAIDTATGYDNTSILNEIISKLVSPPCIITKFNQKDFDNGIENSVHEHITQLGFEPDIILIHSTLKNHDENLLAFMMLKKLFPTKMIGISNFDLKQTKFLIDNDCCPDVMQLEYHPLFQPNKLVDYCKENNIIVMAYRPFAKGNLLKNHTILCLANKYNIKPSHLILKWLREKNMIPVVSSNNHFNILSNAEYNKITINKEIHDTLDRMNMGLDGSTCMVKFCTIKGEDPEL